MIFNMCVFNVFPPPNMLWADSQCFASVSEFELLIKVTQFPTVGKSRLFTWWLILKHDYSTKYDNVKRIYPGGEEITVGNLVKGCRNQTCTKENIASNLDFTVTLPHSFTAPG